MVTISETEGKKSVSLVESLEIFVAQTLSAAKGNNFFIFLISERTIQLKWYLIKYLYIVNL